MKAEAWPDGSMMTASYCSGDEPREVLWVDTEGSQAILNTRVSKWRLPADRIRWPKSSRSPKDAMPAFHLDDERDWEDMARLIAAEKPGLVVIDSLRGAFRGDENASDVSEPMARLAVLARDRNIPIVVVHHLRKASQFESQGEVSIDRVRGSSAIVQFARSVIALDAPDPDGPNEVRVHMIKSNLCMPPAPIGFRFGAERIEYTAAPERPHPPTQLEKAKDLLRTLLQKAPMKATEVIHEGNAAGISERTLRLAKSRLGVVARREGGRKGVWMWALASAHQNPPPHGEDAHLAF